MRLGVALTGQLFVWREELEPAREWLDHENVEHKPLGTEGWESLLWKRSTNRPVASSVGAGRGLKREYLIRRSRGRFIIVSTHSELIDPMLGELNVRWRLQTPRVAVGPLVNHLLQLPDEYCMSAVFARVDEGGRALRTIALYGADLAEAPLFRDVLRVAEPFRVQLRDVRRGVDVLAIGQHGEVDLYYRNAQSLADAQKALGVLSRGGYVKWAEA